MTVKDFAAKYGKTPRTVTRWVTAFDENLSTSINFVVSDNEELFLHLLEMAGVGTDELEVVKKDEFPKGGFISTDVNDLRKEFPNPSLINDRIAEFNEKIGDDLKSIRDGFFEEGGEHVVPHNKEEELPKYNPLFFNPDGSPKSKRKQEVDQATPVKREADIIDTIYGHKGMMAAFLSIPILECVVVFYEGSFSVFENQVAAVLFSIVGGLVGYGMTSAALYFRNKEDRKKVEIGFGILQAGLLLSILLSVPYLSEVMMVFTSVTVFVTARHAIVNR